MYTIYNLNNSKKLVEKIMDEKREEVSELLIKAENLIEELNLTADIILTKLDEKISTYESIISNSSVNTKDIKKEEIREKNTDNLDEKKTNVFRLYKSGYSAEEIARELNIGIGEVQLILNLKNSDQENF